MKDTEYNDFLLSSKSLTFYIGQEIVGQPYFEEEPVTVDVTTLGSGYVRRDATKKAGLGKCIISKEGDKLIETFYWITVYFFNKMIVINNT